MYSPPSQRPPFNEKLAQTSKTIIEYIIIGHNESEINLQEFDDVEEQEDDAPDINIYISIKKISNANIPKGPILYKINIVNNNKIVADRFN